MEKLLSDKAKFLTTKNRLFEALGLALLEYREIKDLSEAEVFIRLPTEAEEARIVKLAQSIRSINSLITETGRRITLINLAIKSKKDNVTRNKD